MKNINNPVFWLMVILFGAVAGCGQEGSGPAESPCLQIGGEYKNINGVGFLGVLKIDQKECNSLDLEFVDGRPGMPIQKMTYVLDGVPRPITSLDNPGQSEQTTSYMMSAKAYKDRIEIEMIDTHRKLVVTRGGNDTIEVLTSAPDRRTQKEIYQRRH